MTIVCNIWMICLELNWFVYDTRWMLQLSQFGWTLRSPVKVVFNKFLLIDATDRNKISIDQKRLFFDVSLYPLSFFANTPFNLIDIVEEIASYFSYKTVYFLISPLCIISESRNAQVTLLEKLLIKAIILLTKNMQIYIICDQTKPL